MKEYERGESEPLTYNERMVALQAWNAAIGLSMQECTVAAERGGGTVGARNCFEIKDAIEQLHIL